jgi:hypothetical protein
MHDAGVLPGGQMWRRPQPAREQKVVGLECGFGDPRGEGVAGRLGQLELHRPLRLVLHHHRPVQDLIAVGDIAHPKAHQVAAAQLAVHGEIEQRQLPDPVVRLQTNAYRPDVLELERGLLANQLALVPRLVMKAFHDRLLSRLKEV